jgi:hypothetical protein
MQLTTSQIDQIFTYAPALCRVVRPAIRAVDHLANSIEAQWEQFPNEHLRSFKYRV